MFLLLNSAFRVLAKVPRSSAFRIPSLATSSHFRVHGLANPWSIQYVMKSISLRVKGGWILRVDLGMVLNSALS